MEFRSEQITELYVITTQIYCTRHTLKGGGRDREWGGTGREEGKGGRKEGGGKRGRGKGGRRKRGRRKREGGGKEGGVWICPILYTEDEDEVEGRCWYHR